MVHTQNIENRWMWVKPTQKKQGDLHRKMLKLYLEEFMWRQEFDEKYLQHLVEQRTEAYLIINRPTGVFSRKSILFYTK